MLPFLPLLAAISLCVELAWDASPSPEVIGYKLYYGPAPRVYTNTVTVGNVTNASICFLSSRSTYYITATAFDATGMESEYCNEVVWSTPLPSPGPLSISVSKTNSPGTP